jgi:hypothetical protein
LNVHLARVSASTKEATGQNVNPLELASNVVPTTALSKFKEIGSTRSGYELLHVTSFPTVISTHHDVTTRGSK